MLHSNDLLTIETMPSWSDISLALYKEFSEQYLIPTIFRYYLENGEIIDVRFEEWAIYHILGIQHINGKISKTKFFEEIENGLDLMAGGSLAIDSTPGEGTKVTIKILMEAE